MLFSLTHILSPTDYPKAVVLKIECQMADSRIGIRNMQDEPGASCNVIKKVLTCDRSMSKGHRIQLKLSNGYRLDDLNNKIKWSWVITQSVKYLWVLTDTHE